jgi:hypothetical protein
METLFLTEGNSNDLRLVGKPTILDQRLQLYGNALRQLYFYGLHSALILRLRSPSLQ